MRLIDRYDILEMLANAKLAHFPTNEDDDHNMGVWDGLKIAIELVQAAKPATVPEGMRQTGKWIKHRDLPESRGTVYCCSICRRAEAVSPDEDVYNVFPHCHCGARMEDNDETD